MDIKAVGASLKLIIEYGIAVFISAIFIGLAKLMFKKMIDKIDNLDSIKIMQDSLEKLSEQVIDLDKRFQSTNISLLEALYDNRQVSCKEFEFYGMAINGKYLNFAIVQILDSLDKNGLSETSRLQMLIGNISAIIDKAHIDILHRLQKLKYPAGRLEILNNTYTDAFNAFSSELNADILDDLAYADLKHDSMYLAFKCQLKNRIYKLNQNLDALVEAVC